MDNRFHDNAPEHIERAMPVGSRVTPSAALRHAPAAPLLYESNSYHGAAIKTAEQARLSKLYPRLYL